MKVPAVGESITEVTVATWNKKEGDHVKLDEVLCELESDKATFELPAEAEGVLHIVAKEGDVLPIGAVICTIEAGGATASVKVADAPAAAAIPAPAPAAPAAPAPAAGPTSVLEIKVPAVGESITEVTVSVWNKKTGDSVSLDEVLCELESDKATFELPAEAAGVLEIIAESGTVVPIGGILAKITVGGSVAASAPVTPAPVAAPSAPASSGDASYAAGHPSPAAAKILDEKGISAASVAGSGVGGRITKEDAVSAVQPASAPAPAAVASTPAVAQGGTRREKMSSLRKTVARRLVAVKNETAMLTTFNLSLIHI